MEEPRTVVRHELVGRLRDVVPPAFVGSAVFLIGINGASYALQDRHVLAIAVWWAIAVCVGLGIAPIAAVPRQAVVTWLLLAAFAGFTGLSVFWAASAEKAFVELDRTALFVGVFTIAVFAATRRSAARWSDGIACAVVGVTLVALGSRFFPQLLPGGKPLQFLSGLQTRLSYPVGYWTGLGVLIALALPLLLRIAVAAGNVVARGAAVAALPPLVVALYLTSARIGVVAAAIGVGLLFALAPRWSLLGALALAAAGSAGAVAVVVTRSQLIDGPFDTASARSAGAVAAGLIALICLLTGAAYALGCRLLLRPRPLERRARIGLYGAAAVAIVVLVAVANPRERLTQFKQQPAAATESSIRAHLFSVSGNARWQLWRAAVKEAETKPLYGRGAGSYEAWWAEHGGLAFFARDAHSLFAETAGELGLLGLFLVTAALGSGIVAGVRRFRRARGDDRLLLAALLATFAAYLVSAAGDWMWEFTVVSVVGIACLGLLTGPSTGPAEEAFPVPAAPWRLAGRVVLGALAVVAIVAQGIPLLVDQRIRESQTAVGRGDNSHATSAALDAVTIQPWASSPYRQVALLEEREGHLAAAHSWILRAIKRDRTDWRLWLIRVRIETNRGDVRAALRSLAVLERLNPNSVLFRR